MLATVLPIAPAVLAGAFIFAGDSNGIDLIAHPKGYSGTGGGVSLTVGIASSTPAASAAQMAAPIQNAIAVVNARQATLSNLRSGTNNNIPPNTFDYESVFLHELGHCIGLAHPNAASESGLSGSNQNYTRATPGSNSSLDLGIGSDGIRGSADDTRGDDQNLHWFNPANNPFVVTSPTDTTTYKRDPAFLPSGDTFAANADRTVAGQTRYGASGTEAVMQQGTFSDEAQRTLAADDVATLRLGMSGLDGIENTGDDYTINLTYVGVDDSADILVHLEGSAFAFCSVGGTFIGQNHAAITTADIFMGDQFNWFFNEASAVGSPSITSPTPGAALPGSSETFSWTADGEAVTEWMLYAGSSAGGSQYFNSGSLAGAQTSVGVTGLPTDGSTIFVRLRYRINGVWAAVDYTYTAATAAVGGTPEITDPAPGATLSGASESFSWTDNGTAVTRWWLWAGSTVGGNEYYNSGSLGTQTSTTVSGLPTDGSTVYVRLWFRVDGAWESSDSTYTAATGAVGTPAVTSPAPGATLSGASETFSWTADGEAVTEWMLYAGSSAGGSQYFNSGSLAGAQTSVGVTGLPTDGSTIYVRLRYRINGVWAAVDYTFTAATTAVGGTPEITDPAPGATLSGASESFSWTDNGTAVTQWWLWAGSTVGGNEYYNSGSLGTQTSTTVSGLPTDGSTVYVRLWFRVDGAWESSDTTYTAATAAVGGTPEITDPAPGATLSGSSEVFNWTANGTDVQRFWIYAGSTVGGNEYYDSGSLGTQTSTTVSGLPTDGSTVYLRLWFRVDGAWESADYSYQAGS